jgi:drug/metabolite transporter (DMT)-like permease
MNNQKKGVLFALCATLLWSVNFVIATGIKGHIPPVGMALEMDNSMCCFLALCHKEHF